MRQPAEIVQLSLSSLFLPCLSFHLNRSPGRFLQVPAFSLPDMPCPAHGLLVCGSVFSSPVNGGPGLQVSIKLVHRHESWGDVQQPVITHHWPRIPRRGSRASQVTKPHVSRSGPSPNSPGLARKGPMAHCSLPTLSPGLLIGAEFQFVGKGRHRDRTRVGRVRHSPWVHNLREHPNPQ